MISLKQKPDNIGALASTLCLLHCIATPFIFIVQSCTTTCCSSTPTWWQFVDYFFLLISFFAIYSATKNTNNNWIKPSLWISWFLLLLIIVNEKTQWIPLNENLIYFPALTLISLHLYNKKFCQCNTNKCANNEG